MSNPFYNYSGQFIPGTLGRAEAMAAEYNSVAAGFSALVYQGVDTGAANAYIVTTQGAPTGSYADGATVEFKATHANTTTSTVNVNGIGIATIYRFGGVAATGGDILANVWYRLTYNTNLSGFQITAPVATTGFSGTISSAPPTNKVGVTASGGVSTAAAPIDATWAIDQGIAPTWTGTHTFAGALNINSGATVVGGNLTLPGAANLIFGATAFLALSPTWTGNHTHTPASGVALTVNGTASTNAMNVTPSAGSVGIKIGGTDVAIMQLLSAAAANRSAFVFGNPGGIARIGTDGTQVLLSDSTNGDLCLVSAGQAVRIGNTNGGATSVLIASTGLVTANLGLTIVGAGVQIGVPTGGDKGVGTLNATGVFINGVSVSAGGGFTTFVKGSDTSRASNTTPADDPDLITGSLATGTYVFEAFLAVSDGGVSGFKYNFNFTGTQVPSGGVNGTALTDNLNPASGFYRTNGAASEGFALTAVGSTADMVYTSFIVVVTVAGVVSLKWSQNSNNVSATILKKGSTMRYQKVA